MTHCHNKTTLSNFTFFNVFETFFNMRQHILLQAQVVG